MNTRSIETIYLSLRAKVAVSTFFMKSPVVIENARKKIEFEYFSFAEDQIMFCYFAFLKNRLSVIVSLCGCVYLLPRYIQMRRRCLPLKIVKKKKHVSPRIFYGDFFNGI